MSRSAAQTKPLAPRQQRFVELYLISLNAMDAYREAYGCSDRVAEVNASRLMATPRVADAIATAIAARSARTGITADAVLREWWATATADANELSELRRVCCRYCYGVSHQYQSTPAEREERYRVWEKTTPNSPERRSHAHSTITGEFDERGGIGYDERMPPIAACPECFGHGIAVPFFKDSRTLSPGARRLYAGVKQTKEGLELRTHDRDGALTNTARHLGMFVEQHDHTIAGKVEIRVRVAREGRRMTAS